MGPGRLPWLAPALLQKAQYCQGLEKSHVKPVRKACVAQNKVFQKADAQKLLPAPAPCPAKALVQAGNRVGRVYLHNAVHVANVYAKLQGRGAHSRRGLFRILQSGLQRGPQLARETSVVGEELVFHVELPAAPGKQCCHLFGSGARVGKDKVVSPGKEVEKIVRQILYPVLCYTLPQEGRHLHIGAQLYQGVAFRLVPDDAAGIVSPVGPQLLLHALLVANGGTQGYSGDWVVRKCLYAVQKAFQLLAALDTGKGVKFVYDDMRKGGEGPVAKGGVAQEKAFQGLRGREQDASGRVQIVLLGLGWQVPVPGDQGKVQPRAQGGKASVLIVDEGL